MLELVGPVHAFNENSEAAHAQDFHGLPSRRLSGQDHGPSVKMSTWRRMSVRPASAARRVMWSQVVSVGFNPTIGMFATMCNACKQKLL